MYIKSAAFCQIAASFFWHATACCHIWACKATAYTWGKTLAAETIWFVQGHKISISSPKPEGLMWRLYRFSSSAVWWSCRVFSKQRKNYHAPITQTKIYKWHLFIAPSFASSFLFMGRCHPSGLLVLSLAWVETFLVSPLLNVYNESS